MMSAARPSKGMDMNVAADLQHTAAALGIFDK
jgi:hypothetical protein